MQMQLINETWREALQDVVKACGGHKRVGVLLWPEMESRPEAAGNKLRDHLDADRREKLSLEQILLLMRLGRQAGVHSAMNFLADELGYTRPTPVSREDSETRLLGAIETASATLTKAMRELDMMRARESAK